jgi:hypothetical protein
MPPPSRQVLRAARAVKEALRRRGLTVKVVFEAEYLQTWHKSHSDMFLKVDSEGPPAVVTGAEAEALLLKAVTLGELEAAELSVRCGVLRKRREKAVMRVGSVAWIGNKEPLPQSMVVPEYLRREETEEASIAAQASVLFGDADQEEEKEKAQKEGTEEGEEEGRAPRKSSLRGNGKQQDGGDSSFGDPDDAAMADVVVGALSPSIERPPRKATTNRLEREAEAEEQVFFDQKRYPALTRETARR